MGMLECVFFLCVCVFECVHVCVFVFVCVCARACVCEGERRGVKLVAEGWSIAERSVFQRVDEKLH